MPTKGNPPIAVRLDAPRRAWLDDTMERLGLDASGVIRRLIDRAIAGEEQARRPLPAQVAPRPPDTDLATPRPGKGPQPKPSAKKQK